MPQDQWEMPNKDHHYGFIGWDTHQARIGQNIRPSGAPARHRGGVAIDAAVTAAFLAALKPVALRACVQAAYQIGKATTRP